MANSSAISGRIGAVSSGQRHLAQWLFVLVYLVGMLDRSILTVLLHLIKLEFHLSDTQLGFISGMAFSLAYAAAAVPMGLVADRMRRRTMLALIVFLWSALTFVSGLAPSFLLLCLARFGVGFAEAGQPPLVMSLVGDLFARDRRATAISLIYIGVPAGALVGFLLAGGIAAAYGWRIALMGAGVPGMVLAAAILLFLREPVRGQLDDRPPEGETEKLGLREGWRYLRSHRALMHVLAAAGAASIISSSMSVWLPSLIMRRHGVGIEVAGPALAISMGVFGIVGALFGGPVADRIGRGSMPRIAVITALMMATMFPLACICFAGPNVATMVLFNGLFNMLVPGYLAGLHVLVIGLTAAHARGFMISLLAIMFTLVGYGVGSQLIGMLSDGLAAQGVQNPLLVALLLCTGTLIWASLHLLRAARILRRSDETEPQSLTPSEVVS